MRVGMRTDDGGGGEKCPPGFHVAVLAAVFDIGRQPGFKPTDQPQEKVMLLWEVNQRDSKGRRFLLIDTLANYLGKPEKPSKLSGRFAALLGAPLTADESENGIDTDEVVGRSCYLAVSPPGPQGKWPKITSAMPLPPGTAAIQAEKVYSDEDPPPFVSKARDKAVVSGATQPAKSRPAASQRAALPAQPVDADPISDDQPPF